MSDEPDHPRRLLRQLYGEVCKTFDGTVEEGIALQARYEAAFSKLNALIETLSLLRLASTIALEEGHIADQFVRDRLQKYAVAAFDVLTDPTNLGAYEEQLKIEKLLRLEYWFNHGCSGSALYGDDGEMQCNACLVDFRRTMIDDLTKHVEQRRAERLDKWRRNK